MLKDDENYELKDSGGVTLGFLRDYPDGKIRFHAGLDSQNSGLTTDQLTFIQVMVGMKTRLRDDSEEKEYNEKNKS